MQSSRPYQYRRRPVQRALDEARSRAYGERATAHVLEVLEVRERLPGWAVGRACRAAILGGLI